MAKPTPGAPAKKVELYERLVATNPRIQRKDATMPYTSLNGHMFSVLAKDGTLALRLPSPEREEFLKKYKTTICEMYGAVMPEYVGSLKPKPATTKKAAPKK